MSGFLLGLLGISIVLIFYQQQLIVRSKSGVSKDQLMLQLKILSLNPNSHFAFNSLNSIKNLVLKKEVREASKYLSTYAQVMRQNQSSGSQVFSLLKNELEGLLMFTDLERLRFKGGFDFSYYMDHTVDQNNQWIPSYYLQPLIEQVIWNSLSTDRTDPAKLVLALTLTEPFLECTIKVNAYPSQINADEQSVDEDLLLNEWLKKRIAIFNRLDEDQIVINKIELIDSHKDEKGIEIILRLPVKPGNKYDLNT